MMQTIEMILLVAACFFAAVLNLAAESRFRRMTMRAAIICAVCVGAVLYGYGYAWTMGISVISVLRALLALCRMFGGVNDLASVQAAPLFSSPVVLSVFWLGHFLAFYVTASAAIATLGERLLRHIRVKLLRRGPLLLIYGINSSSVAYGQRMVREKRRSVLFVDQEYSPVYESAIKAFGGVVDKSGEAFPPTARFLRQINMKPGSRRLEVAALEADGRKNLAYARQLLDVLTETGVRPEQTALLAAGAGEESAALQSTGGKGYGSVWAFDDHELTARIVVRDHPPCDQIAFDSQGRAAEDFHAVILGFGRMGRAMLSQLVMNGQFYGSRFRVDVFDQNPQNGFLHEHPLMRNYDIRFHAASGKSDAFYSFIEENRSQLRWISLCTGKHEENREIAEDLAVWFRPAERQPLIVQASREGYICHTPGGGETQCSIYDSDWALDLDRLDQSAMQIHHIYTGSGKTAQEDWKACGYFNRLSSRASADFYPAVLRAAGKRADQVRAGDWPPPRDVLENLAVTEHLRWCAFHHAMGYAAMPEEIWRQRAERWQREKAEGKSVLPAIGKDADKRLHACLIPWEALDELSDRENAITGGHVDYKQMDRNNVLVLANVLAALGGAKESKK